MTALERFIEEKLSKKVLSANAVRDTLIAVMIVAMQRVADAEETLPDVEGRVRGLFESVLKRMGSFEYPPAEHLTSAREEVEKALGLSTLFEDRPEVGEWYRENCRGVMQRLVPP